jgi:glucose/arabinose dehydrogenase
MYVARYVARHRTALALAAGLALGAGLAPGCGDDDDGGKTGGNADSGTGDAGTRADAGSGADGGGPVADCKPQSGTNLSLELVARGFDQPVFVTSPPGDPRLFVVSKHGAISIVKDGQVLRQPFLDIDDRVASAPADNEQGLLGLAFHPDFARNGRFFVFYTRQADDPPDRLSEFRVSEASPDIADPESEREIFEVADLEPNHNGGMIAFGKDGYLYAGLGDGGGGGDQHGDIGNGQDKSTLLGDILRIDVNSADKPYAIPPDNPYAGSGGNPLAEIFISGVRNPWRWSFDSETGDLYIGDVGQGKWEEVDVLPAGKQAGKNLGWRIMEGDHCYPPDESEPCDRTGLTLPVAVYPNPGDGASVIGGYVYRGACSPDIRGWYFYGDYNKETFFKFVYADGAATAKADVTGDIDPESTVDGLASFGQDAAGEIYVVSLGSGEIYRIVAGP